MRANTLEIRNEFVRKSADRAPVRLTTQQAWAAYLRRRFPRDCLAHTMATFGLSDGRARGAVFGSITQRTVDQILAHKNGGPLVALAVEATAWEISSRDLIIKYIEEERARLGRERQHNEAEDRRWMALSSGLDAAGSR